MSRLAPWLASWRPRHFLLYSVLWLAGLTALTALSWRGLPGLPEHVTEVAPAEAVLGGAVGGAFVTLLRAIKVGREVEPWDQGWNRWHLVRPVVGAFSGGLAFVALQVLAAAVTDESVGDVVAQPAGWGVPFVVGFLVGFRDRYFLALLERLGDVLFPKRTPDPG